MMPYVPGKLQAHRTVPGIQYGFASESALLLETVSTTRYRRWY